jgi:hypothetical protein
MNKEITYARAHAAQECEREVRKSLHAYYTLKVNLPASACSYNSWDTIPLKYLKEVARLEEVNVGVQ